MTFGTTERLASIARRTEDEALQQRQRRQDLEAQNPLVCEICEAPLPDDWSLRQRAYDWLERHGRPMQGILCDTCLATKQRESAIAECQARAEELERTLPERLAASGVPAILREARLDTCPDLPAELVQTARAWAESPRGFLLLLGPPGAGKSHLAAATMAEVILKGKCPNPGAWFTTEAAWLAAVRLDFGQVVADERPHTTGLLVLDDIGSSYMNDIRRGELERLIRDRHAEKKPTILTTNLDLAGIDRVLGGRVLSALRQWEQINKFPRRDLRQDGSVRPM